MTEELLDVDKSNLYILIGQNSFETNSVVPVTTPSDLLRITFFILQMMIRRNEFAKNQWKWQGKDSSVLTTEFFSQMVEINKDRGFLDMFDLHKPLRKFIH